MTDEPEFDGGPIASPGGVRTGLDEVDGVLESLGGLVDTPVSEHVAVYERAHELLRSALDAPSDTPD